MNFNRRPFLAFLLVASFLFLACVLTAAKSQSSNPEYQSSLKAASKLMMEGKYDDAVQAFRTAIKLSGGNEYAPYWGLAQTYNQLNDKLNTLETCDRMIALAPTDVIKAQCHNLKGLALAKGGATDPAGLAMAETEFRAAIKLDPDYADLHFNLGKTLLFEKKIPEGTQELNAYLKEKPDGANSDEAKQLLQDPSSAGQKIEVVETPDNDYSSADDDPTPKLYGERVANDKGRPVPAFSVKTLQGERISQDVLRGKVVLVEFWASWCGPCKRSFPDIEQLYSNLDKEKFTLLSISVDRNEHAWRAFVDARKPAWPQARDSDGRLMRLFVPATREAVPTFLLIDSEGIIRLHFAGWGEGMEDRVEGYIKQLLDSPAASKPHK